MAVNKVVYGNDTLIDITDSTVDLYDVVENNVFYKADGSKNIGLAKLGLPHNISINSGKSAPWVRPLEYPNLDEILMANDFEGVYLTYDLRKVDYPSWIGVYCRTWEGGSYNVERGHLENGVFIVDLTHSVTSNTIYRENLDSTNGDIQLWRIDAGNNKTIRRIGFVTSTSASGTSIANNMQPCVERVGQLRHINDLSSAVSNTSTSYVCFSTVWLLRDKIKAGGDSTHVCTTLSSCYNESLSLKELDVSLWDTRYWTITNLTSAFQMCLSLETLDLSYWDTSNWAVTSFNGTFYYCASLKSLDISSWDTSNWKVTGSIGNMFYFCQSLKDLKLSNWDTSNWTVTNIYQMFYYCYNLKDLNKIQNWDTSNWKVTRMDSMFYYCFSLNYLDLSNWDVSDWPITRMDSAWNCCHSLKKLNISNWDVSDWPMTNISATWSGCYSLQELDISNWDTSNWAITTIGSTWSNCRSLMELNISNWDTSNWQLTAINSAWSSCYSLKKIDLSKWETTKWNLNVSTTGSYYNSPFSYMYSVEEINFPKNFKNIVSYTTLSGFFRDCRALKKINFKDNLDLSNVTSTSYIFSNCMSLELIIMPNNFTWPTQTSAGGLNDLRSLINITGWSWYNNISITNLKKITKQSLVNIINSLPQTSTTLTFSMNTNNLRKLTAEEIAVGTAKGWTITA